MRAAIAAYLAAVRGLRCDGCQVVVTSGAQEALDLVARLFLNPGDAVWMEDPGYAGLRAAFAAAGARVTPVPVDAEGLDVEAGKRLAPDATLAAVTPSHQYPLGVTMSLGRRLELLDWARANDAWILEDDYDSEFRYAGKSLPALQGLDDQGRVIYVGTFSKVLFPALRLGYLVLPEPLIEPYLRIRSVLSDTPSIAVQPPLAQFIEDGHFAAHLRRMRALYAERQGAFIEAVGRHLDGVLEVAPDEAEIHLIAGIAPRARVSDAAIAARAGAVGVLRRRRAAPGFGAGLRRAEREGGRDRPRGPGHGGARLRRAAEWATIGGLCTEARHDRRPPIGRTNPRRRLRRAARRRRPLGEARHSRHRRG
ncbi:MAG: PLP-dependent aminotransferase family protein, partial [Rhodospirillaceae bacterium]